MTTEDAAPKPNEGWLTRQQLTDLFDVDPATITRYERNGMPVAKKAPRGQHSLFDPEVCRKWKDDVDAMKLLATSGLNLDAERARLTRAQAEKVERENLRRQGELIEREEVSRAGQAYTAAWSAKVRTIPRRMTVAGLITREQEPQVALICREILIEIAGWKTLADVEEVVPAEQKSKPKRKAKKKKKSSAPPPAAAPATPVVDEAPTV